MIASEGDARSYVTQLSDEQAIARLDILVEELLRENELQNLVAKKIQSCVNLRDF